MPDAPSTPAAPPAATSTPATPPAAPQAAPQAGTPAPASAPFTDAQTTFLTKMVTDAVTAAIKSTAMPPPAPAPAPTPAPAPAPEKPADLTAKVAKLEADLAARSARDRSAALMRAGVAHPDFALLPGFPEIALDAAGDVDAASLTKIRDFAAARPTMGILKPVTGGLGAPGAGPATIEIPKDVADRLGPVMIMFGKRMPAGGAR